MTKQVWQCPKCRERITTPLPVIEVACGNHQKSKAGERNPLCVLVEGSPYVPPKSRQRQAD